VKNIKCADESFNLWWLLDQTRHLLFRARQKELDGYNISVRQAAVLFVVEATGEQATPVEISRRLLRRHHTITGILSRMEKEGLVRKTKDLERKNLIRVSLTEKG
jgi:MarR family transcriptional regulator for hemolysin